MNLVDGCVLGDSVGKPHWTAAIVDQALCVSNELAAGTLESHEPKEDGERPARTQSRRQRPALAVLQARSPHDASKSPN
jgi:hypothetical protein